MPSTRPNLVDLRAEVARRAEDLRIARKHEAGAAARVGIEENVRAYQRAHRWTQRCAEAERQARSALIRAVREGENDGSAA